jgi:hypothetical protein
MAKKKARRRSNGAKAANGKKLGATVKKWGWFRGPGKYARTQTGIQAAEKVVPAALALVALTALTPSLGAAVANSLKTIPVAGPVANSLAGYGVALRSRVR